MATARGVAITRGSGYKEGAWLQERGVAMTRVVAARRGSGYSHTKDSHTLPKKGVKI